MANKLVVASSVRSNFVLNWQATKLHKSVTCCLSLVVSLHSTQANSRFENPHYEVWRRYRDFEWLRDQIERTFPTLIVPVSE